MRAGVALARWLRVDPAHGRHVALLLTLYFCQGLPFGFQARALPLYLRSEGVSLGTIGLLQFLATPWMLKVLWAPLVDRFGSTRLGRRKSWILPMQAGLVVTAAAGAFVPVKEHLGVLLALVLLMNFFAATQDIAVDGLAVDLLHGRELGAGNAAQVTGYKLGMTTAGGLLVWASGELGWAGVFLGVAALCAIVAVFTALTPEPIPVRVRRGGPLIPSAAPLIPSAAPLIPSAVEGATGDAPEAPPPLTWREMATRMLAALRLPGAWWLIAFIGTYKVGETMVDRMYKLFLFDAGYDAAQLGLWLGTWGMAASIAGSALGGLVSARAGLFRALAVTALLRATSVAAEWLLAAHGKPSPAAVIGVSVYEHFCGGLLTTALFAFMMSRVDPRIGATHFTLFATVEVLGKAPTGALSGYLAERLGYADLFGAGAALSFAFLALLWPIAATLRRAPGAPAVPAA